MEFNSPNDGVKSSGFTLHGKLDCMKSIYMIFVVIITNNCENHMDYDIEDALDRRLKVINDWLQFAEKKNATLLVLNAGAIWGVSRLVKGDESLELLALSLLWLGLAAIGVSAFFCVFSLLPNLKIGALEKAADVCENDNSLFFGDIAKYSPDQYLELLRSCYQLKDVVFLKAHRDYAEQLIVNSRIAKRKYVIFGFTSRLTAFGFVALFCCYISSLIQA